MIYDDLGGFGTNGTNGTIMGHTEWHASGLWMLASSMETVYGKETTYNTKARYRRGVQSRHYSNAFRNYMYMYCRRYEKDCWCRRGEGEGYHAMHSVYSANILSCIILSYSYYLPSTLAGPLGRLSQGVPLVPGLLLLESLTGGGESGMCTVALWTSLMT